MDGFTGRARAVAVLHGIAALCTLAIVLKPIVLPEFTPPVHAYVEVPPYAILLAAVSCLCSLAGIVLSVTRSRH